MTSPSIPPLFSTHGRLPRRTFAYAMLAYICALFIIGVFGRFCAPLMPSMIFILCFCAQLLAELSALTFIVRRYHDFGVTGWLPGALFLAVITFGILRTVPTSPLAQPQNATAVEITNTVLSALALIVWILIPLAWPPQKRENRYGQRCV